MSAKDKLSLLLPVHNEAESIEQVILSFYEELRDKVQLEIVVAEDGSTDGTKEILKSLAKELPLKLIMSEVRKGYSGGVRDGLRRTTGTYVLFCDSDGQHYPSDFWKLYEARTDWDIISGWRVHRVDSFSRKMMSRVFQWLAKALFDLPPLHDITCSYKLIKTEVAKNISQDVKYMAESYWTEFTIRACATGARVKEVPVQHRARPSGTTRIYGFSKLPKIVSAQLASLFKLRDELVQSRILT